MPIKITGTGSYIPKKIVKNDEFIGRDFFDKDKVKKLKFSKKETESQLTKKSFVEKFLQSVKQKMYSGKKN